MEKGKCKIVPLLLLLFKIVLSSEPILAQNTIKGYIIDSDSIPIEYVNITILNPDSSFIKGGGFYDGYFEMFSIEESEIIVNITALGYKQTNIPIKFNSQRTDIFLKNIVLDTQQLDEVIITAKRPTFRNENGKIIVNTENTILSDLGTSIDVLKRIPMLIIDASDNITVAGKDNAVIFIDGRQIRSNDELRILNSSNVKKVEVIIDPTAEYDATGHSVIHIYTKTNTLNKLSGSVRTQVSYSDRFSELLGGELNAIHGENTTYLSVFFNKNNSKSKETFLRETTAETDKTVMDYSKENFNKRNTVNYILGNTWDLSWKHKIGAQLIGWFSNNKQDSRTDNIIDFSENPLKTLSHGNGRNFQNTLNLNYRLNIDSVGHSLDVLADHTIRKNKDNTLFINETIHDDYENLNKIKFDIYSLKIDYSNPIHRLITFRLGSKYSQVRNKSNSIFNSLDNREIEFEDFNNNFSYAEYLLSAYVSASFNLNKAGILQTGIRMENDKGFGENNNIKIIDRSHTSFFPNIIYSKDIKNKFGISLSYAKRINRPAYSTLNPTIYYFDEYTYSQGNPELKPTISTNYGLSFSYNKSLFLNFSYSYRKNPIFFAFVQDENNPLVTKIISTNYSKAHYFSVTSSFTKVFFQKWSTSTTLGFRKPHLIINDHGKEKLMKKPTIYFTHTSDITLPLNFTPFISYNYYILGDFDIAWYENLWSFDVGLKKTMLKNKLVLNIYASDIFDTNSERKHMSIGKMKMSHKYVVDDTFIRMTLSYNFGVDKINFNKRSGNQEEINRL
ncbi:outer membrane beta-barrel family protein [Proteiniphilum sp. X52]|uniref:outer membrane beta-barrel family protein n=1 Tax=Proteiniphilum sp. X52 TaxID=2382159 RepID=UPI000F09DA32|nr:outer membrane beta-barrel protein [Proteiniphilum sp. X52]RNC63424.1 TonB-dependent receptor [Proteiniphilum sp. X52]